MAMSTEKKSPFDFINSILNKSGKMNINGYTPFIVNRGLSYYKDCVLWANEVNRRSSLDVDMQYDFLYNTVTKGNRRFAKWAKTESNENIELISQYYQVNIRRATEILSLINNKQLEMIREQTFKGGRK